MSEAVADKTILVVDDNPGTLYSTGRVLRSAGFKILEAKNGSEAITRAQAADLVILDINLPDMNGFDVCSIIRSNPATSRVPVIHLSASFVQARDKVRGLNHGADGYLTHPVEGPVLVATVNAFLRARKAEEAMQASEAKFRAIFDQTPLGVALTSEDFVFLEVNSALCEMLGRSKEQVAGKHTSAFLPAGRLHDFDTVTRELDRSGRWRGVTTLIRWDANPVLVEWSISRFTVPGIRLAIAVDITDRRAVEAERERLLASERAARAEAERANRMKDDFLATLSHELRTPLNAMKGWTQILRQGTPDPNDLVEGLEAIDRNVNLQAQLIADLLEVSRIASGKLRLEIRSIDAATVVERGLESVAHAAKAKGIAIRKNLEAGVTLDADPSRLQQIIWNLVNNAIKFTPAGGVIEVVLTKTDEAVVISISDNGQGISPEFLPHLFERFSQADASSRRVHGGLGLGLAIVKNLTEMHGGTVAASSPGLGKGATFTLTLPIISLPRAGKLSPQGIPTVTTDIVTPEESHDLHLEHIRVLVVDDDADARKVLGRLLKDYGAEVEQAGGVRDALEKLEKFAPNVIVTDIGMPVEDGYDLVRRLRGRKDALADVPVVALTAFVGREQSARSIESGFQVHLGKPVNPSQLVREIRKLTSPGK